MDAQELGATVIRAGIIYVTLLFCVRVLGRRTIGQVTAFDLVVTLIIGDTVDEAIFGDTPLIQALLAVAAVTALHYLNSFFGSRSKTFDRLIGGEPRIVVRDGKIDHRALMRERINETELLSLLRLERIEDIRNVERATLEPDGKLSVIKTEESREAQKSDLTALLKR